jgi:hypothetical protein
MTVSTIAAVHGGRAAGDPGDDYENDPAIVRYVAKIDPDVPDTPAGELPGGATITEYTTRANTKKFLAFVDARSWIGYRRERKCINTASLKQERVPTERG